MRNRVVRNLILAMSFAGVAVTSAFGYSGIFDHPPFTSSPPTLTDVARMIDNIQSDILNQGTVVVKQPDIWSQARMTKFRKEFEDTMRPDVANFNDYLSARIARSDSASLQSQTALGAALTPFGPTSAGGPQFRPQITDQTQLNTALTTAIGSTTSSTGGVLAPTIPDPSSPNAATFSLLNQVTTGDPKNPGQFTTPNLGVEPNVHLDEKADYLTHLHRIRRVNLGDDNSDSAGYGLYLMRVPVSIQPGDKTVRGHGAIVNMTMGHDFGPRFLPATYRNLVINDVVDLLAPVIQELIRTGDAAVYHEAVETYRNYKYKRTAESKSLNLKGILEKTDNALATYTAIENSLEVKGSFLPVSRSGTRSYAIAPSDVKRVFVSQNLLNLAYATQRGIDLGAAKFPATGRVRGTDVRSYLRQELDSAYDLLEGRSNEPNPILMDSESIENLTDQVYKRTFESPKSVESDSPDDRNEFYNLYEAFTHRLPGNTRYTPIGVLCWGITLEAGLLNRQLREDIKQTKAEGYVIPANIDEIHFYLRDPMPDAEEAFQAYIKARWPMITFSLEPVVDQQNIEDSFTRRRDLQLAIAFALSSGRLSFRQAIQYTRQLQYEAQTIALNQTVSAFAHGNDTFGWRFTPRYQTPPEESNRQAITNLLLRGGPGPNYQIKHSKIEPGLRELTAVVVMPSFVRGMRLDVSNDWFRLSDPDERKISTARTIELGRRINETRAALTAACGCGLYRPEDTERLKVKLHQLEAMLPMQTQFVKVPYENTLGGFALFTQGVTALVPELSGHEGVQYFDPTKPNDILVYGKHFSIYEMAVVAGGVALPREGTAPVLTVDPTTGKQVVVNNTLSPLISADGNRTVFDSTGKPTTIVDSGSYDILSREVLRLHLPARVNTSIRDDGQEVVEIYVSTPNGISNRLHIPVKPGNAVFAPIGTASAYTFLDTNVTLSLEGQFDTSKPPVFQAKQVRKFDASAQIRIKPNDLTPPLPPSISIQVVIPVNNNAAILPPIPITDIPLQGDTYVIDSTKLNAFAATLSKSLSDNSLLPTTPTITLLSRPVQVQPNVPGAPLLPSSTTSGGLTISFDLVMVPTPVAAAPAAPVPAAAAPVPAPAAAAPAAPAPAAPAPKPPATPIKPSASNATTPSAAAVVRSSTAKPDDAGPTADPFARRVSLTTGRPAAIRTASSYLQSIDERLAAVENATNLVPPATGNLQSLEARLTAVESAARTFDPRSVAPPATIHLPALPSQVAQSLMVVSPKGPTVNVIVPITNTPPAKRHGLLNRKPATPAAPATRGPLLERLMGRP